MIEQGIYDRDYFGIYQSTSSPTRIIYSYIPAGSLKYVCVDEPNRAARSGEEDFANTACSSGGQVSLFFSTNRVDVYSTLPA